MSPRKPHPDVWPYSQYTEQEKFSNRPTADKFKSKAKAALPPLEKDIERKIGDFAKKNGCLYYKFTSPARRAVPDRMIITPQGVIGFLEVKAKGKKPTLLQLNEIIKLTKQNCNATWCSSVEEGCQFIKILLHKKTDFC